MINGNWVKLSKYALMFGLTYKTANRHHKEGKIPFETKVLPTGSILVNLTEGDTFANRDAIIYCRVSSPNKKGDLQRQIERCSEWAAKNGLTVVKTHKEVASGMNDSRRELNRILDSLGHKQFTLVVENRDRLTRFGLNYLRRYIEAMGSKLVVINASDDDQQDLVKDLVSVITSFCCRLYGLRRGANKAREIKNQIIA